MYRKCSLFSLSLLGSLSVLAACAPNDNDVGTLPHDGGATGGISGSTGATGGTLGSGGATGASTCTYKGKTYAAGDVFMDDCNSCQCGAYIEGEVLCTMKFCPTDGGMEGAPSGTGGGSGTGGIDAPVQTDAPLQVVDAPIGDDGPARPDGRYFKTADGREMMLVDYCLPILPLESGSQYCPATLDDAEAALLAAFDGGIPDARPYMEGIPMIERPCVEPLVVYLPYGRSLGWGAVCYYDESSGHLLSITTGSDTTTECVDSPIPNTVAFTARVFGQLVTCTYRQDTGGDSVDANEPSYCGACVDDATAKGLACPQQKPTTSLEIATICQQYLQDGLPSMRMRLGECSITTPLPGCNATSPDSTVDVLSFDFSLPGGLDCQYSRATGLLVGQVVAADTPRYCGGRAYLATTSGVTNPWCTAGGTNVISVSCDSTAVDGGVHATPEDSGGASACSECGPDELCVAYYDGTCKPMYSSCNKVSAATRESILVNHERCFGKPIGNEICGTREGQPFWGCGEPSCGEDKETLVSDINCYGP